MWSAVVGNLADSGSLPCRRPPSRPSRLPNPTPLFQLNADPDVATAVASFSAAAAAADRRAREALALAAPLLALRDAAADAAARAKRAAAQAASEYNEVRKGAAEVAGLMKEAHDGANRCLLDYTLVRTSECERKVPGVVAAARAASAACKAALEAAEAAMAAVDRDWSAAYGEVASATEDAADAVRAGQESATHVQAAVTQAKAARAAAAAASKLEADEKRQAAVAALEAPADEKAATAAATEEVARLRQDMEATMRREAEALRASVAALTEQAAAANGVAAGAAPGASGEEVGALRTEVEALRSTVDAHAATIAAQEATIAALGEKFDSLCDSVAAYKNAIGQELLGGDAPELPPLPPSPTRAAVRQPASPPAEDSFVKVPKLDPVAAAAAARAGAGATLKQAGAAAAPGGTSSRANLWWQFRSRFFGVKKVRFSCPAAPPPSRPPHPPPPPPLHKNRTLVLTVVGASCHLLPPSQQWTSIQIEVANVSTGQTCRTAVVAGQPQATFGDKFEMGVDELLQDVIMMKILQINNTAATPNKSPTAMASPGGGGGGASVFGVVALPLDSKHTRGAEVPMPVFDEMLNMRGVLRVSSHWKVEWPRVLRVTLLHASNLRVTRHSEVYCELGAVGSGVPVVRSRRVAWSRAGMVEQQPGGQTINLNDVLEIAHSSPEERIVVSVVENDAGYSADPQVIGTVALPTEMAAGGRHEVLLQLVPPGAAGAAKAACGGLAVQMEYESDDV